MRTTLELDGLIPTKGPLWEGQGSEACWISDRTSDGEVEEAGAASMLQMQEEYAEVWSVLFTVIISLTIGVGMANRSLDKILSLADGGIRTLG